MHVSGPVKFKPMFFKGQLELVVFINVKVMKNEKRLRNCHRLKET